MTTLTAIALTLSTAGAIQVQSSVIPVQDCYFLDEPIEVDYRVRNSTADRIVVTLGYPEALGLRFNCTDPRCGLYSSGKVVVGRTRIPSIRIEPGGEFRRRVALNRYLVFDGAGEHRIEFETRLSAPMDWKSGKRQLYASSGDFSITICGEADTGRDTEDYLNRLAAVDLERAQEAAEMLLWLDRPEVISHLDEAASTLPPIALECLWRLERHLDRHDAWESLEQIASQGWWGLQRVVEIHDRHDRLLPEELIRSVLRSTDRVRAHILLEYMLRRDDLRQLQLVRPWVLHHNDFTADLAKRLLARKRADVQFEHSMR